MGRKCIVNGYTAWANMRLVRADSEADDILSGLMQGRRMKFLLQGMCVQCMLYIIMYMYEFEEVYVCMYT